MMKFNSKFWVFLYAFIVITCFSLIIGLLLTVYFNETSQIDRIFWTAALKKTAISFFLIISLLSFFVKKFVKVEEVNWDDFLKEQCEKKCQPSTSN